MHASKHGRVTQSLHALKLDCIHVCLSVCLCRSIRLSIYPFIHPSTSLSLSLALSFARARSLSLYACPGLFQGIPGAFAGGAHSSVDPSQALASAGMLSGTYPFDLACCTHAHERGIAWV